MVDSKQCAFVRGELQSSFLNQLKWILIPTTPTLFYHLVAIFILVISQPSVIAAPMFNQKDLTISLADSPHFLERGDGINR